MTVWLHNCPRVDDNYGPQVVEKGKQCPFCGMNEEQTAKVVDDPPHMGMTAGKG